MLLGLPLIRDTGGNALQPVRCAAQRQLPEGSQRFFRQSGRGEGGRCALGCPQPLQQVGRLQIHNLHLMSLVKDGVRHMIGGRLAGDGLDHVSQTLQILDVQGAVHVDAGTQKLLDVLIAVDMAAARAVGMGHSVHKDQLGPAGQSGVQIKFSGRAHGAGHPGRQLLQTIQQRSGGRRNVPGHGAADHIRPGFPGPMGGLQHGIGLTHAGGVAKEDFQLPRGGGKERAAPCWGGPGGGRGVVCHSDTSRHSLMQPPVYHRISRLAPTPFAEMATICILMRP